MKELVTKRKKYLIILQKGICPPKMIKELKRCVAVGVVSEMELLSISRYPPLKTFPKTKILVIGDDLNKLRVIEERFWCCVGVLLNENEKITFVENGFSFHDWQEVLDIISNKKVQQMINKDASVQDIILALQDGELA
jgi:hypothetical protein